MVRLAAGSALLILASALTATGQVVPRSGWPSQQKKAIGEKKYDDATKRASKAYYVAMIAADKQLVADLQAAEKVANTDDVAEIRDELKKMQAKLDHDLAAFKGGAVVQDATAADGAKQEAAQQPQAAASTPKGVYESIEVGKTKEDDAVATLKRSGWVSLGSPKSSDTVEKGAKVHTAEYNFVYAGYKMNLTAENGIVKAKTMR